MVKIEPKETIFDPKFFAILNSASNWTEFEKYTHYLLKLLGLHQVCSFPPREQRGKADGFLIFKNLVVLFDMTLERDFESVKDVQIDNFCDQLKGSFIQYGNRTFDIGGYTKQVWIITRDFNSRIIKSLPVDDIVVKEVPISKVMELYRKRLIEDLDEAEFEKELRSV